MNRQDTFLCSYSATMLAAAAAAFSGRPWMGLALLGFGLIPAMALLGSDDKATTGRIAILAFIVEAWAAWAVFESMSTAWLLAFRFFFLVAQLTAIGRISRQNNPEP